jgi:hypothetical protein
MVESSFTESDLAASSRRMRRIMWGLAGVGAIAAAVLKGAAWGLSFLFGAVLSIASFHYTKRFVRSIGPEEESHPGSFKVMLVGLRYLLAAGLLSWLAANAGLQIPAALFGLLTGAAAVVVEIICQLIVFRSHTSK